MNILRQYLREKDGATALEFSLITVPFFLIMLGVFETGRLMWTMNTVQYAVEDTARYAAVTDGLIPSEIEQYAEDKLEEMSIASSNVDIVSDTFSEYGIDWIEIDVTYQIEPLFVSFIPFGEELFTFTSSVKKPLHYD